MDDLISRQDAIDALDSIGSLDTDADREYARGVFNDLPPAQPEREKGKWVLVTDNNGQHYECSRCGAWRYHQEQEFCGSCGRYMWGKNNGKTT